MDKSTTIRMILGLDAPTGGSVTVNGRPYARHSAPLREVGALLEARAVHTSRSAANHLLALAATVGISRRRVDEVIALTGLTEVADKRAGAFSLGMSQRLGIAAALLGDPAALVLDEPVNGLDPEGILWIRTLLKKLAAQGRTVFVSSHLMSEMALTAEQVIIVGRGRLIADVSIDELTRPSRRSVLVRSHQASQLQLALAAPGVTVTSAEAGALKVEGLDAGSVGRIALAGGIALSELTTRQASLEEAFMELTHDDVEYRATRRPPWPTREGTHDDGHHDHRRDAQRRRAATHPGSGRALRVDQAPVAQVDAVDAGRVGATRRRHRIAAMRAGQAASGCRQAPGHQPDDPELVWHVPRAADGRRARRADGDRRGTRPA